MSLLNLQGTIDQLSFIQLAQCPVEGSKCLHKVSFHHQQNP